MNNWASQLMIVILLALFAPAAALAAGLSDDELVRAQAGEILLQTIDKQKPGGAARVTAVFHSNANVVWDIIGYCKYAFIYIRGLQQCEVLEPGLYYTRMHHRLRSSWYAPTLDFSFEASRSAANQGEVHLIDGNLKVLEGRWDLVALTGAQDILVSHEIRIQPKILVPKWLVRRSLRKDLPNMLACIRGLAGASGDNRRIALDLKRCPGDISEHL